MTDSDTLARLRAYLLRPSVRDLGYVYLDTLNAILDDELDQIAEQQQEIRDLSEQQRNLLGGGA